MVPSRLDADDPGEGGDVQLGGGRVELRPAHGGAGPLGGQHPRPDVRVVVQPGHHDLVAG
jgi:hypothetical protein